MMRLTIDFPESALSSLRTDPVEFALEFRLVAAVKWYELGRLSQGRAAEFAGISRAAFVDALSRFSVTPFQYSADEIAREAHGG